MGNDPIRYLRGSLRAGEHVLRQFITADTDLAALSAPECWKCDCPMTHFCDVGPEPALIPSLRVPGVWKRHGWRCVACGTSLGWSHNVSQEEG